MRKGDLLYEGKAKKVFKTDDPVLLIQQFKDDATAFDGVKKSTIAGKGVVNNTISCHLFNLLEQHSVRTHFVERLSDREMLIKALKMVPVEVIMRNVAAGSICRRYGMEEGLTFNEPILELYFKSDPHHDPLMNVEHVVQFNLCPSEVLEEMDGAARKTNTILREFFRSIGINLVDFKLEFGLHDDQVFMGDEISPDTCRFWDLETGKKLDKDRFRFDLGDVRGAYQEMLARITAG
jgi:phosphoribosylaminoimidazole-succinocarboxamide synthase